MAEKKFTNLQEKNIKNNFKIVNKNFKLKESESIKEKNPYRDGMLQRLSINADDSTRYGEFVPSFFNWMTLDEQKARAKDLNNMTKNAEDCK